MRKQFILDPNKIRRAKKILKAETDTETVDQAMNIVISNQKIAEIHQMAGRVKIRDMDPVTQGQVIEMGELGATLP